MEKNKADNKSVGSENDSLSDLKADIETMRLNLHSYQRRAKEHSTKLERMEKALGALKGGAPAEAAAGQGPSLDINALSSQFASKEQMNELENKIITLENQIQENRESPIS